MKPQSEHYSNNIWLYRVVFTTRFSVATLLLLFAAILVAPIEQAFANEVEVPDEEALVTILPPPDIGLAFDALATHVDTKGAVAEVEPQSMDNTTNVTQTDESMDAITTPESSDADHPEGTSAAGTDTTPYAEVFDDAAISSSSLNSPGEYPVPTSATATPVTDNLSTNLSSDSSVTSLDATPAVNANELVDDGEQTVNIAISSTTATTTDAAVVEDETVLPLYHVTYSDSGLSFSKDDCTLVHDGSYYCNVRSASPSVRDGFYAYPDADGDLEIFLVRNGTYFQLTDNLVEDASPYYDAVSESVVWHREIDGRYQIVTYSLSTGEEQRFTEGLVNDMEPSRYDHYTVWQRWGENGFWQIMLNDGEGEYPLTDAPVHNIGPRIRGHFVIWHTRNEVGDQVLQTYDMLTRTYTTILDDEDAAMANPRLMMVYEAVYENGDVVTRGYDMATGKVVPLSTLPQELPDELPDAESTGETRALIQPKPGAKEIEVSSDDKEPHPDLALTTSTKPVDVFTLDLSAPSATTTAEVIVPVAVPDLIILPATSTHLHATE